MRLEHDMARERDFGEEGRVHQGVVVPTFASASTCARARAENGACVEQLGGFRGLPALRWGAVVVSKCWSGCWSECWAGGLPLQAIRSGKRWWQETGERR